ncbi:MAG: hypothetical protein U1F11_04950 [Steroidobacteraceae bacterium]
MAWRLMLTLRTSLLLPRRVTTKAWNFSAWLRMEVEQQADAAGGARLRPVEPLVADHEVAFRRAVPETPSASRPARKASSPAARAAPGVGSIALERHPARALADRERDATVR